mgnify:CR=1 FL=1
MENISFLIGLKNNLEYSQKFYENTRLFYPDVEIVFVSYGSTDGTHQWLDYLHDKNLKYYYSDHHKTLSDTYNKATEISTKEFVCFLHNDMVLGNMFLEEISIALKQYTITYYKTIEPPIFGKDERLWKEVKDFGNSFEDFDYKSFYDYEKKSDRKPGQFVDAASFFLACKKDLLLNIGGLDPLFSPMFCEDDDLILRLQLSGEKIFFCANAITYHFVSKTSRFSEEFRNKSLSIEKKSHRNFLRKWGFQNDSKSKAKYDIGIILENGTMETLSELEPLASKIYTDFDFKNYIKTEQLNTSINLNKKIHFLTEQTSHDITVYIDGGKMNAKTVGILNHISEIVSNRVERKQFQIPYLKKLFYKLFKRYKPIIIIKEGIRTEKKLIKKNGK